MELEDGAYPFLSDIQITSNIYEGFSNANWVLLLGGMPRKAGMERRELLSLNAPLFAQQGRAIAQKADTSVRVLVVANPCNTNAWVAMKSAPEVPQNRWFSLSRLDENRARAALAKKLNVPVTKVENLIVWGNHSLTLFPDFYNATVEGRSPLENFGISNWLETDFVEIVRHRATKVLDKKGSSSGASAAQAIVDTLKNLLYPDSQFHSIGVCTNDFYEIENDIIFSLPVRAVSPDLWEVAIDWKIPSALRMALEASADELREEYFLSKTLLNCASCRI